MAGNRAGAEKFILQNIQALLPGSVENTQMYKDLFASMSDKAIGEFLGQLKRDELTLAIVAPNMSEHKLTNENNLELAKKLDHNFFERVWIDNGDDVPPFLSNKRYQILLLPLRRQAQLLVKKISIPEDSRTVDNLTGQPTGSSKGSKLSYPETQVMAAYGLDNCLVEMLKFRGGDVKGFDAMNTMFSRSGSASLRTLEGLGTTTKSTTTLHTILTCMHIRNTL